MNKMIRNSGIMLVAIIIFILLFFIFNNKIDKNSKKTETNKIENEENLDSQKEYSKLIQVNGKLYSNSGEESTVTGRCGNIDGKINSNVNIDEIPVQDNQSNFDGEYEYQYGAENTIEVKINGKWFVFREVY